MSKHKHILTSLCLLASTIVAQPIHASTFKFSYVFNTGQVVTGSFSGDLSGDLVSNLSNISVSIDGLSLVGLTAYSYTAPGSHCVTCYSASGAVASFDPLKNNFVFSNANLATGVGVTNYFYIMPWPNGAGNPVATQALLHGTYINYYNGQFIPQNWHLAAVPELQSGVMLIAGLTLIGIRRSSRQAN